jgi:hypothetical protein
MTLSDKRFRSYGVLKIDFAVEFCFWTEQRLNRTHILVVGLAETPEVPNTIMVGHSLSFLIVHNTAPNGQQFLSYSCQKLDGSAESGILGRLYLLS